MQTDEHFEREPDADRIIAFTDAAVAIALTLLVLPLMEAVAKVTEEGEHLRVGQWLQGRSDAISAFVMSFGLVAVYWNLHHRTTVHVRRYAGRMVLANFAWLLGIVSLAVTSGMVVTFVPDPLLMSIYIGTFLLIVGSLLWLQIELMLHPEAGSLEGDPWSSVGASVASILLLVVIYLIAAFTPIGYYAMFLMCAIGVLARPVGSALERMLGDRVSRRREALARP